MSARSDLVAPFTAKFGVGTTLAAVASGAPGFEIQCPVASTRNLGVTLIDIENTTAVLTEAALSYATAQGVDGGGANTVTPRIIGGSGAPQGRLLVGWATSIPTFPAAPVIKAYLIPATVGQHVVFSFPEDNPLLLAPGSSLVFWDFGGGATAALVVNVEWKEFTLVL